MGVKVGIIMGSQSDWATMSEAAKILDELGIPYEKKIVSAHRTPDRLWSYGKTAVERGLHVIIAGAGGAAHLPGMMASKTRVPVGTPIRSSTARGTMLDQWPALTWARMLMIESVSRVGCGFCPRLAKTASMV